MNSNTVTVTIPEGYTVMQTIQLLAKKRCGHGGSLVGGRQDL